MINYATDGVTPKECMCYNVIRLSSDKCYFHRYMLYFDHRFLFLIKLITVSRSDS